MRILFLVFGAINVGVGIVLFGFGVSLDFFGITCFHESCSFSDPLVFIGLLSILIGMLAVYTHIQQEGVRSKLRVLMGIALLILNTICVMIGIFFFVSIARSFGGDISVYSNVPEGTESAPFGVYDRDPPDVRLLEYEIDGEASTVEGVLLNNATVPITYVHLKFSCGNGQDISFVVGSRKKTIQSLNRMTDQYENREYDVPEAIDPGETYHFEYAMNDATVTSACSLSVDGWTDYRTITQ